MAAMQAQRQSQNTTEAEDETFGPMLLARLEVVCHKIELLLP